MDSDKTITMSEIMTPEKINFSGNIHGGYLLSLLDRVAYACAARYAKCNVVTLSVDKVLFKQPIHVNELVTCHATVNYVGHTSMEVGIKVIAENLLTGEKRHTNSCYFTMVATDEHLRPIPVRSLEINTPLEQRRHEEALLRRELDKQYRQEHKRRKAELDEKLKIQ